MKKLFIASLVFGSFMITSCGRNVSTSHKNTSPSVSSTHHTNTPNHTSSSSNNSTGILPSISDSISKMMS